MYKNLNRSPSFEDMKKLLNTLHDLENFCTTQPFLRKKNAPEPETSVDESDDSDGEFIHLLDFEDYEIYTKYPYPIRRKSTNYVLKTIDDGRGYARVKLHGKDYFKHILLAKQFIPNDDPAHKIQVDHINRNNTDNHISNLRWVTVSQNNKNHRTHKNYNYSFVKRLPEGAIPVNYYGKHQLENYFYHDNTFYEYTGVEYKILIMHEKPDSLVKYVNMIDTAKRNVCVSLRKFKKQYNIKD